MNFIRKVISWLTAKKIRWLSVLVLSLFLGFIVYRSQKTDNEIHYQTARVEKGTLVSSVSASGTVTSGNNTSITTKAAGTVHVVYVTNGDTVTKGQKIAEITLDEYAKERQTAAWVTYLDATEALKDAQTAQHTADIAMWEARQEILDAEDEIEYKNNHPINSDTEKEYTLSEKTVIDKTLEQKNAAFRASESKYINAVADIANAQAKVAAALRNYHENSATIVSPADGVLRNLNLAPGMILNASSTTSNTSGATIVSAQTIGKVQNTTGQLIASVSLSELDVINVKAKQKVTLTLDAYPDKSFTGNVLAVDTDGSSTQGVTSYPATILIDQTPVEIYPNMAVTAEIMLSAKADVLLIPSSAVQTTEYGSAVDVMQDGKIVSIPVETGETNDTQTEIVSGLSQGDVVVTATIDPSSDVEFGSNSRSGGMFMGGASGGARIITR